MMRITAQVKAELANIDTTKHCCRKAETSTMVRFAGTINPGRIEVEVDTAAGARRLSRHLHEIYGHRSDITAIPDNSGLKSGSRYMVRVITTDDSTFARQAGVVDHHHRPIQGLPPHVVTSPSCDSLAAWRAAFLARGTLTDTGRSPSLEVTCPSPETALALAGLARRHGIKTRSVEVRGVDRVVIRDHEAIANLLNRLGAPEAARTWQQQAERPTRGAPPAGFDTANRRRSVVAAKVAAARAVRALEILDTDTPEHLRAAGVARVAHEEASLEALGKFHDPPLTKDAIAGRIRRLIAMADKRARELGIPGTELHTGGVR
jgi:cell division protein WhiA